MKSINKRKNQYIVSSLHCLLTHVCFYVLLWCVFYYLLQSYSGQDYDLMSWREKRNLNRASNMFRYTIPGFFAFNSVIFCKLFFPIRRKLIVIDENGVFISRQLTFGRSDYFYKWTQIKNILFDIKYDSIEIMPTYGKAIRIRYSYYRFFINFYHMAKAMKEYSGDDDIVSSTKPLWHCYLYYGYTKDKPKPNKHTPPNNRKQIHY